MSYPLPAIDVDFGFAGALIALLRNFRLANSYAAVFHERTDTTRVFFTFLLITTPYMARNPQQPHMALPEAPTGDRVCWHLAPIKHLFRCHCNDSDADQCLMAGNGGDIDLFERSPIFLCTGRCQPLRSVANVSCKYELSVVCCTR